MRRNAKVWLLSLIVAIAACVAVAAGWSEPSYKGKRLTRWLRQCYDASLEETQKIAQAQLAINSIGADKALPILMEMIQAEDGKVRSWIIHKNEKWDIKALKLREGIETRQLGVVGFEALGTNAASAVPELTAMLADTNTGPGSLAMIALRCLIYIGMPAEKAVCGALTNQNPEIRAFATSQISWVTDDIRLYVKRLEGPLNDADGSVRFAAVQGLGLQTGYPDEVLQLLVKAMHDPAQSVSGYAAKFIGDMGTNGVKAFEPLKEILETGNPYMATHALRSLMSVAPDRALPLAFGWMESTNQEHRSRAAMIVAEFPKMTPEILDRLKGATKDSNPKVARTASAALTKLRQKEKDAGVYKVLISGEPTYGGKLLGDWLKRKPDQQEFSPEAKRGVEAMGTNAISALLARLVYVDRKYGLYDYDAGLQAVGGFILLGKRALPALPKLAELMRSDNKRIAVFAMISCCNMGTNAVPVFLSGMTNRFADVRNEALHYLTEGPLTAFPEARKGAVPQMLAMLHDPDESNRMNASNALWGIDAKVAAKAGVKPPAKRWADGMK